MQGIDLNRPIVYHTASLRYFEAGECHVTRFFTQNVLILVFDGVLRFTEDGVAYEIGPGRYHIQKAGTYQTGNRPSDTPKYLYVHFDAEWSDGSCVLPPDGSFSYGSLQPVIHELDQYAHNGYTQIEQLSKFYEILVLLYQNQPRQAPTLADQIAAYLASSLLSSVTLSQLSEIFHFSKNHVINVFKAQYGMTPFAYLEELKIKRAEYLMVVTSDSLENISCLSGFSTYSQFYKLFVRKNRISPGKWRKQNQP